MRLSSWISLISLTAGFVFAQPKWSVHLGGGFYEPGLTGFTNSTILPDPGLLSEKILVGLGLDYQFYPNARVGYTGLSSYHLFDDLKSGGGSYSRALNYRMLTLETYFRFMKRMELNFTLAPMWNKGSISVEADADFGAWDSVMVNFGNESANYTTSKEMTTTWFGFGSMIGYRFYLFSWLALDARTGFMLNYYSADKWKFKGKKGTVSGPALKIKELPIFTFRILLGW